MKSPPIKTICDQVRAKRTAQTRPVLLILLLAGLILVGSRSHGYAGNGTWISNPADNDWNNPANWSGSNVPTQPCFSVSDITDISITANTGVTAVTFKPEASPYRITALPGVSMTTGNGGGIGNLSGVEHNFVAQTNDAGDAGSFVFEFGGRAGDNVVYTQEGARLAGVQGGSVLLTSTFSPANAGSATFRNLGGTAAGASGGTTVFQYHGNAAESTIINEGAQVSGAAGGATLFYQNNPSAENATLIANAGSNGGGGGTITFEDGTGGTAQVKVFGNGYMDMSIHNGPSLSIGSIEGDGQIYLGKATLIVGTNSLSTTFSGILHPGGPSGGNGSGALSKTGTGMLSLPGANLYTNGTTVTQGVLAVSNTTGSGTGTGPVQINAGTIGGNGIIAGAVTVGTGSGAGALLTPGIGTNNQTTLTIQSALTFNSDATYVHTFKGNRNRVRADLVNANGVTINGGTFAISSSSQNRMRRGTVLTVINNTSADPISSTFSNLSDGAIVNVNGNNLQASYSGGDGNDLVLTVVP